MKDKTFLVKELASARSLKLFTENKLIEGFKSQLFSRVRYTQS